VASLPPEVQAEITEFIVRHSLGSRETRSLAQAVRRGSRDDVQRIMSRLAREDVHRSRAAVSWEPLLHAIPRDVSPRLAALHAELEALPEERRAVRLHSLREQRTLMVEVIRSFDELLALFGETPAPTSAHR
jgi:hypothetical protein